MPNLKALADKNGVTIEEAVKVLGDLNFKGLSASIEITDITRLLVFDRALYSYKKSKTPRKKSDETSQSREVPSKASPEEVQRQLLSRDFVIFTYMALRKPQSSELLCKILELRYTKGTSTKIVVTSIAQDMVHDTAASDKSMAEMAQNLTALEEKGLLTVLRCKSISEEFGAMCDFLSERQLSDSIVIVGVNRPLRSFVNNRNSRYKANPPRDCTYCPIVECDVSVKSTLTSPKSIKAVFDSPENAHIPPFDETTPLLPQSKIPEVGSTVYVKSFDEKSGRYVKHPIILDSLLCDTGGEALIYTLRGGKKCVKIFRSKSLTEMKVKKIELMCQRYNALKAVDAPLTDRIAWPEQLVCNENDLPLGYIMKYFPDTRPLIDYTTYAFESLVPGLTKAHQVTMAVSICEILEFCHYNNIILCDINKSNVLYGKDGTAYLCDIDSAQLCDKGACYPSNVGIPEFLPPERVGTKDFSFIRRYSDDVWILQILLFYILTPCGSPYAFVNHKEIEDMISEPIRRGIYPFASATKPSKDFIRERHASWDIIISHLHYKTRDAFYNCFSGLGTDFTAECRRSAYDWLDTVVEYRRELSSMCERDLMSGEYIPTAYRQYDDVPSNDRSKESGADSFVRMPSKDTASQTAAFASPEDKGKSARVRRVGTD